MIVRLRPIAETSDTVTFARSDVEAFIDALDEKEALRAHRATRTGEKLPADVVRRLATGEHPVRVCREHRGLSAAALAA